MRRRDFIQGLAGSTVVWPLVARAQQPTMPVIGFLGSTTPDEYASRLRIFREGLKDAGYVEGENCRIEYRWADGHNDRLPKLAVELVQLQVAVIAAASGTPGAIASRASTTTIPIVFGVGVDPVKERLVASLARPGGNMTGVTNLNVEIGPKRLELMHALLPKATAVGVLVDPTSPDITDAFTRGVQSAAGALGIRLQMLRVSSDRELDSAFATFDQSHLDGLIIGPSTYFAGRGDYLGDLATRYGVPAIFQFSSFTAAGGLLSYGTDETEYYRLVGGYVGRVLKGEKPADLPVQQSTKVELIINLKTAKKLGIDVPLSLLGRADEVIE